MKLAARVVFVLGSIEVYDASIDDYVVIEPDFYNLFGEACHTKAHLKGMKKMARKAERVHARVRAYWAREAKRSIDG